MLPRIRKPCFYGTWASKFKPNSPYGLLVRNLCAGRALDLSSAFIKVAEASPVGLQRLGI